MTTEDRNVQALLSEGDTEETLGGFSIEERRKRIQRERVSGSFEPRIFPEGLLSKAAGMLRPIFQRIRIEREERKSSAQARDFTFFLHGHGRRHDFGVMGYLVAKGHRLGIHVRNFSIVSDRSAAPTETDLKNLIESGQIPICVGNGPFSKPVREDETHSVVLNTLRLLGLATDPIWRTIGDWDHSVFSKGPGGWTRTQGMIRTVSLGYMNDQTAVYYLNEVLTEAIRSVLELNHANPEFKKLWLELNDQATQLGVWLGVEQHPIWQKLLESPNSSSSWENTLGAIKALCLVLSDEPELASTYVDMILDSVQAEIEEGEAARAELSKVREYPKELMHRGRSVKLGIVETNAVLIPRLARNDLGMDVLVRVDETTGHVIISGGRNIDLAQVAVNLRKKEAELKGITPPDPLDDTGLVGDNDVWFYKRSQRYMFESLINGGFTHPGMAATAIKLEDIAWLTYKALKEG